MLDKKIINRGIIKLGTVFEKFNPTDEEIEVWYECFGDMKEEDYNLMIIEYIKNNVYKPNIGALRECWKEYKQNNPYAGWEVIR